jgi:hypothetical protein
MKKILIGLMLVGCGTQTPQEKRVEDYANEFVKDCQTVYGDMCTQVRLEAGITDESVNSCWTEDSTNKRGLGLTPALVNSNNKTEIYKEMLNCTVFATENTINFVEFAERLNLQ